VISSDGKVSGKLSQKRWQTWLKSLQYASQSAAHSIKCYGTTFLVYVCVCEHLLCICCWYLFTFFWSVHNMRQHWITFPWNPTENWKLNSNRRHEVKKSFQLHSA